MPLQLPAYLKWRDGRPRWEPGPKLRHGGHPGRDLKDDAGRWLGLEAAIAAASAINAEIALAAPLARPRVARHTRTVVALVDKWRKSPDYQALRPSTRTDYKSKSNILVARFGDEHPAAIAKSDLYDWWEELYRERGHHMANGVLAVAGAVFRHAEMIGWREDGSNPTLKWRRRRPAPRLVLWLPAEVEATLAAADRLDPSIGDAFLLALHSGQRMGDVVAMPARIFEEGRIALRQYKRSALVDVPVTRALAERVAAIRARWKAAGVVARHTLIARADGTPWPREQLSRAFREVRTVAARQHPAVADKRLQDLRDTAVTRLALAGCTMAEIAAITGHSLASITAVMKHYLALQPEMADAAIAKLEAWLAREQIAV